MHKYYDYWCQGDLHYSYIGHLDLTKLIEPDQRLKVSTVSAETI